VFSPLLTTNIGPVAMTSDKKSPLLTPTGPLFLIVMFSSEKDIVKEQ
jgi:hypothetical protein